MFLSFQNTICTTQHWSSFFLYVFTLFTLFNFSLPHDFFFLFSSFSTSAPTSSNLFIELLNKVSQSKPSGQRYLSKTSQYNDLTLDSAWTQLLSFYFVLFFSFFFSSMFQQNQSKAIILFFIGQQRQRGLIFLLKMHNRESSCLIKLVLSFFQSIPHTITFNYIFFISTNII